MLPSQHWWTYLGAEVLERETLDGVDAQLGVGLNDGESTRDCTHPLASWTEPIVRSTCYATESGHTEELLGTALLHDLNQTRLQLLNRGNVVGEDTHLTSLGGDVDLDTGVG